VSIVVISYFDPWEAGVSAALKKSAYVWKRIRAYEKVRLYEFEQKTK